MNSVPLKEKAFETLRKKKDNAGDQHFLLSQECFLLLSKKSSFNILPHSPDLTPLEKKALENIVGKGENTGK